MTVKLTKKTVALYPNNSATTENVSRELLEFNDGTFQFTAAPTISIQSSPPTYRRVGDLWFENSTKLRLYIWNGTYWIDTVPKQS